MSDWLASLPPEPGRKIIAVSHGVAGRVLRGVYANLPAGEAVAQDVPQDAVYLLQNGLIGRIDCEPVD
jgi:probable phosphoglycerate mutase